MLELLLASVDDGEFDDLDSDIDYVLLRLASNQPTWGTEVLAALISRTRAAPDASNLFHPQGHLRGGQREFDAPIRTIATKAPGGFVERVLPVLLEVMGANKRPEWAQSELVPDALWSHQFYNSRWRFADQVFSAMSRALGALADADPESARLAFGVLRAQPYEAAALLLAAGYTGNPTIFADEAADWLIQTPGALLLGYVDAPAWLSRELIEAITPVCQAERLERLADALVQLTPQKERSYEARRWRGSTELCLLNGVAPDRRPGRVERRLAELRRKFGTDDVAPPQGFVGGAVPPPIHEDRARLMTDEQWLAAMRHYSTEGATWREGRPIGDAWTQAQVLETFTKEDPQRFARLLLSVAPGTADAYVGAILRGLTGAPLPCDLLETVCQYARVALSL